MTEDGAELPADFNETAYLAAYPKIAENIGAGFIKSAADHYLRKGVTEKRLEQPRYRKALAEQQLLARLSGPAPSATPDGESQPAARLSQPSGLDTLMVTPGGLCLAIGWVDDRGATLTEIALHLPDGRIAASRAFARCRRLDAESAVGCPPGHLLGFYGLIELDHGQPPPPGTTLALRCGFETVSHPTRPNLMQPEQLRDTVFEYLAAASYFGSPTVESFLQLQGGFGDALLGLNRAQSARIAASAFIERHGPHAGPFRASLVVCLFGRTEYLFLQAAAFSTARDAADYEYVYVSNSPELTESLQREARIAARLYGLSFTLVILPGNAGFGAANNAAVAHAASRRVLICNPDVFPRTAGWAARHAAILEAAPPEHTRLWGAPLFYDDGSLMHGGMYFEADAGLSVRPDGIARIDLLRVEHYGKGAPPDMKAYAHARPVPAVSGAFMSADRAWFERLGGFAEDYVFGHYEDADLCLRSWQADGPVWFHTLPLWHLEGKGSNRRPAHEGGSLINRWHFSRIWLATVQDGFAGPTPARLAP